MSVIMERPLLRAPECYCKGSSCEILFGTSAGLRGARRDRLDRVRRPDSQQRRQRRPIDTLAGIETLPVATRRQRDVGASAELRDRHSEVWKEAVDGAALVPHIIEQFLKRDREFKRWKRARCSVRRGRAVRRVPNQSVETRSIVPEKALILSYGAC